MTVPALVGWEGEKGTPFPVAFTLFYPKSWFPVTMGDVAETEEASEFIISLEKMSKEKYSSAL